MSAWPSLKPPAPAEYDRRELERGVRCDERIERRREASLGEEARQCTCKRAVVGQIEQAAYAGEQSGREALKGDADVVADVETEHHPIGVCGARAANRIRRRRIHLFERCCGLGAYDGQDQLGSRVYEPGDHNHRQEERRRRDPDVAGVPAYGARKVHRRGAYQSRQAELTVLIDDLMRFSREPFQSIGDVRRVGPRPGKREMFAGAPIERGHALASHRYQCDGRSVLAAAHAVQQCLELRPLGLVRLFEAKRRHERRPSSHCATPSTRRVTSGPARPASPETDAANAASSSSRSAVSVGARAARAMTAA